jgi:hypothetical protein
MKAMSSIEVPAWVTALRQAVPEPYLRIADDVWLNRTAFIEWPSRPFLFMPGTVRVKFHRYSPEQLAQIKAAGGHPDTRSNGPAIMAYAIAGGRRPGRASGREQWSIHHIYDGQYPASGATSSTRAVMHGNYFTEAAGLVSIHPIADALADVLACFAWLLRHGRSFGSTSTQMGFSVGKFSFT